MAGDWIKMRCDLGADPRVQRIAAALKVRDSDLIVGKLWRLWAYADQYTTDGRIPHATSDMLDRQMGLRGLCRELEAIDWITFDDQGAVLPRFEEHNGDTGKQRAQNAKRQARLRGNQSRNGRDESAEDVTQQSRNGRDGNHMGASPTRTRTRTRTLSESVNVSAAEQEPENPRTEIGQSLLLADIRKATGETDHDGLYRKIIGTMPETYVRRALSELAAMGSAVLNPGKVFTARCRDIAAEVGIDLPIGEKARATA